MRTRQQIKSKKFSFHIRYKENYSNALSSHMNDGRGREFYYVRGRSITSKLLNNYSTYRYNIE